MSQFKGTPGNWQINHKRNVVVEGSVNIIEVPSGDGGFYHIAYGCGWTDSEAERKEAEANARVLSAAPDLLKALEWALPLAKIAMDTHRMTRIECGHKDIEGTYKNGVTWLGIYQSEVDQIERAEAALAKALSK